VNINFDPMLGPGLEDAASFEQKWRETFGNDTWKQSLKDAVQEVTEGKLSLALFDATYEIKDKKSAVVSLHFRVEGDVVAGLLRAYLMPLYYGFPIGEAEERLLLSLEPIIKRCNALWEDYSYELTVSMGELTFEASGSLVANLDDEITGIKNEIIDLVLLAAPTPPPVEAQPIIKFVKATGLGVSELKFESRTTEEAYEWKLDNLELRPPVKAEINFTLPEELFQLCDYYVPAWYLDKFSFALEGVSNGTHTAKVLVPPEAPRPVSRVDNVLTWVGVLPSELSLITFKIEPEVIPVVFEGRKLNIVVKSNATLVEPPTISSGFSVTGMVRTIEFAVECPPDAAGVVQLTIAKWATSKQDIAVYVAGERVPISINETEMDYVVSFSLPSGVSSVTVQLLPLWRQYLWALVAVAVTGIVALAFLLRRKISA
jgi:hypothetical protein